MKKKVGILLRRDATYHMNKELVEWILEYNMVPIGIVSNNVDDMIELVNLCDGVILQGGVDYTEEELTFTRYLYEKNIPTFGICLGMQTMAVALGGVLKTLPNLNHQSNRRYVHEIMIKQDTRLYQIIKCDRIYVNSRHKDYIEDTKLNISACSMDSIIEAIEDKDHKFFIGVQWHPESIRDIYSIKLLKAFKGTL